MIAKREMSFSTRDRTIYLSCRHDPADEETGGLPANKKRTCYACGRTKRLSAFPGNGFRHMQCNICTVDARIEREMRGPDVFRDDEPMSTEDVARFLGITDQAVRQIEERAMRKIRLEIARLMRDGDETWALIGAEFGYRVVDYGVSA